MTPGKSRRVLEAASRAAAEAGSAAAQVQWLRQRLLQLEAKVTQLEQVQHLLLQHARSGGRP